MFRVEFKTDNAAFEADAKRECARLVLLIADSLLTGITEGTLHDLNGNHVGIWGLVAD